MLKPKNGGVGLQAGLTLIEVLVTMVIVAFGLMAVAILQGKAQLAELESYQRAQAVLLLDDMLHRMNANGANAEAYVTGPANPIGTGDSQPTTCGGIPPGVARDQCEWSVALKGAAEQQGGTNLGAMIGARGCVELVTAPDPSVGVCQPGVYRISVAWQGLSASAAPSLMCSQNLYGDDDALRRIVSTQTIMGLPACTPS